MNAVVGLVVLSILCTPIERILPVRRSQRWLRPGYRTDVVHFVLTGTIARVLLALLAIPVLAPLEAIAPAPWHAAVAAQPAWQQLVEALLIVEVVGYWAHRMAHTVPALWRLHRVHHSSPQMDWLASAHLHPLDTAISRWWVLVPLALLGFSPETFGAAVGLLLLHAVLQHANVRCTFGPLRHLVSSPQFHHWHHANDVGARHQNFAGLFPWIDRLFGTHHLPKGVWPTTYGIDEPMAPGYLGQLASPFRRASGDAGVPVRS